ncbi:zinc finger protein 37 homolog [Saccostrea cucullata]|uniref:zinc finger protein 37 homolog n=1 Tax=Saccostrea cuccullata TaxID=36930 RepID=UPI002ED693A1
MVGPSSNNISGLEAQEILLCVWNNVQTTNNVEKAHENSQKGARKIEKVFPCGRLFKQSSNMWGHIRAHTVKEIKNSGTLTHPPDRSSVHECGLCVRVFSKKSYLLIHRKVQERPDTHKCQVCNGVFGSLGALNRHKRNVHQMYINIYISRWN